MIELRLYGDLGRYGAPSRPGQPGVLRLPAGEPASLGQLLGQTGIAPEEVAQVFLNGQLLNTCCSMAPWLGYQTARERLPAGGDYLETLVRDGDRLGLFPLNMAMLVV
ncbi:MAG: hypothetical protein U9R05_00715 [Chloroflexota bacterium]|nr:hypothetical protein [Chloroflexota bacterium]